MFDLLTFVLHYNILFLHATTFFIFPPIHPTTNKPPTGAMQSHRKPPYAAHRLIFSLTSLLLAATVTSQSLHFTLPHSTITDPYEFEQSNPHSDEDLDRGSWIPIFDPQRSDSASNFQLHEYYSVVRRLVDVVSDGGGSMVDVYSEVESISGSGDPHVQSLLGFLYGMGMGRECDSVKAFVYHQFAADNGSMQSKFALAYTYNRQKLYEKAVILYAELAEAAVNSFSISEYSTVIEPVRIHNGAKQNKEALMRSRRKDDEDFLMLEYQAQQGNVVAMNKIGLFYYFGLRGIRRDYDKAFSWFSKAADKGDPKSMDLLGEIYARGVGVERNYTKALEWLTLASKQQLGSAYNGIGYLYFTGYGVEQKNYTKAKEYFEKAADNDHQHAGGLYNLGVMYLKGIGVKKDVKIACKYFILASNTGNPIALYQLAKMFHTGEGLKKNLPMATSLYKVIAEKGPWSSLYKWALDSYLKGEIGKALLLYSRMAELGYEVAQSNAAWILDTYGESSMCVGVVGLCTDSERHQRAHYLWRQASKQGNEYAAMQIGDDASYYDQGLMKSFFYQDTPCGEFTNFSSRLYDKK